MVEYDSENIKSLLDAVKNRYMYQRVLLDEALQMVYRASDKSIGERVRFKDLMIT